MPHTADQFPLLDHISSGIVGIDRNATIHLWNERMEHWTGLNRQEMIGQNLFERFPRAAEEVFKLRIEQVLQGGAPIIFSPQLHHHLIPCPLHDGGFRPQLVTVTWLPKQEIALFSIQDQTEQAKLINQYKETASALANELKEIKVLRQENKRLVRAIDQAGEAIIISNRHGQIKYCNKAFTVQTGWSRKEARELPIYRELFQQYREEFDLRADASVQTGQVWQGRSEVQRKDGSSFTASISIAPVIRKKKKKNKNDFIIIQEDITSYVHLEEKMRHTQKQEALVTLVGGIAHDFNNLLAGLVGQVYLASREVKDRPKTADRLQKIQGITQEAAEIVGQLLTFARQGEMQTTEFPLTSFIKEFMKLAQHSVPENIQFTHDFEQGAFNFRGDANLLQQSLLNIIQNSVEACDGREDAAILVTLRAFHCEQDPHLVQKYPVLRHENFAHLSICDNGRGIPDEIIDKIFDPFFTTKQLGSGAGLYSSPPRDHRR